jgi:SEC-C motif
MRERLHNGETDAKERCGLAVALSHGGDEKFPATVVELYNDRASRARALQAMWRSFNREFATYASQSLDDEDADIREQAILATGYLNQASEASRLEKLFTDETHRDTALFAYALCAPSEVTPARMRQLFKTIEKLAGALSPDDAETLEQALDLRLEMHGLGPAFDTGHSHDDDEPPAKPAAKQAAPGRNDPCPCGSGKKFKKCHGQ